MRKREKRNKNSINWREKVTMKVMREKRKKYKEKVTVKMREKDKWEKIKKKNT